MMKKRLLHCMPLYRTAFLILIAGIASSCRATKQRVDFTWFRDACTPAQNDTVQVEGGCGLPPNAAPALATKRKWAPWQQQANSFQPAQQTKQQQNHFSAPPAAKASSYTVQPGDTLSGIAHKTGVRLSALYGTNRLTESTAKNIRPGQVLRLPQRLSPTAVGHHPAAEARAAKLATPTKGSYTVRQGDTLGAIAVRHHTTVAALAKANRLTKQQADHLRIGQRLTIPRP